MKRIDLSNIAIALLSIIILGLPYLSRNNILEEYTVLDEYFFQKSILASIVVVMFFLINYYILIPKLYFHKKYMLYLLCAFVGLYLTYQIPNLLEQSEEVKKAFGELSANRMRRIRNQSQLVKIFFDRNSFQFYITFIVAFVLRTSQQIQEIKWLQAKTELSYLKAQINPHFLFNTLNSIYALTLIKSDLAPKAILKLSSMMRYVVTESEKEWIDLEQEIQYLQDYIELQKLRLEDATTIDLQVAVSDYSYKIASMLLIPFIENAFKYGTSPGIETQIQIKISQRNEQLHFECSNPIVKTDVSTIEKTGTGIQNTIKRLEAIYPNRHQLDIQEKNSIFKVNLSLTQ